MVENMMLIALGFLTATLLALCTMWLVWRRAVKVTTRNLTSNLNLDELKQQADRATALEVALQDKKLELTNLTTRKIELEDALNNAIANADELKNAVTTLRAQNEAAKAEAENHLKNLGLLQARIDELEAAARRDMDNRDQVDTELNALSEKANRLIADMQAVTSQIAGAKALNGQFAETNAATEQQVEETAPTPTPVPEMLSKPVLTPYQADDEKDDDTPPDIEQIKASLMQMDETPAAPAIAEEDDPLIGENHLSDMEDEAEDDGDEPVPVSEGFLADRIRALKAGMKPSAQA